jgi:hypothetical protein
MWAGRKKSWQSGKQVSLVWIFRKIPSTGAEK